MRSLGKGLATSAAMGLLAAAPARAAVLKPMNLEELTRKADRIFSGTVVSVERGRVAVGGGTLPTVTYRIAVDRAMAGVPEKGASQVVEVRMIGDPDEVRRDRLVRLRKAPPRPDIEAGQRYLLFVTAPGPIGLSTTVGLGQGCFRVGGAAGDEDAVNEFDNAGLFRGMNAPAGRTARGPIKFAAIAERVRALRGRR
jgi:hypothetical protein